VTDAVLRSESHYALAELDVYDHFRAAAEVGFRRAEVLCVHPLDPERVERELCDKGLELALFDPAPAETASLSLDLRRRFAVLND
jgi:hydroxypyruvate isomerase